MSTKIKQILILLVAATTTAWAHQRLPNETRADRSVGFVPDPQMARLLDFGFDALMSDYHWLQAIQIAGGSGAVDAEQADELARRVDVVTTLNPYVGHPYRFAAVWLTHNDDQVREAIRLLERATQHDPDEWRNYFYIGFNHFFYLNEFEAAAAALEEAIHLPGRPAYLPRLVARLKSETSDIDVAEVFLRELLRSTEDDDTRAKIQSGLDEIEIEYKARHLDQARAHYRDQHGRDIEAVTDLLKGDKPVLRRLPSPEPDGIPEAYARGSRWKLGAKSGRIVSTYTGKRYEVHFSGHDKKTRAARESQRETNEVKGASEHG